MSLSALRASFGSIDEPVSPLNQFIKEHYSEKGAEYLAEVLSRTPEYIRIKAHFMGLRRKTKKDTVLELVSRSEYKSPIKDNHKLMALIDFIYQTHHIKRAYTKKILREAYEDTRNGS